MLDLNAPQPPPTAGEGPAVWPLIYDSTALVIPDWLRADMRARHELGVAKYGTALKVWNGRDAVIDAYQEALDLIVYAKQARERLGPYSLTRADEVNAHVALDRAFHWALNAAVHLGELARAGRVPLTPTNEGKRR